MKKNSTFFALYNRNGTFEWHMMIEKGLETLRIQFLSSCQVERFLTKAKD